MTIEASPAQHLDLQNLLGLDLEMDLDLFPLDTGYINPDQLPQDNTEPIAGATSQISRRNRNPRSCDFCRVRKTACIIETSLPCTTCRARGLQCTFAKRRRRGPQQTESIGAPSNPDEGSLNSTQPPLVSLAEQQNLATPWQIGLNTMDLNAEFATDEVVYSQGQGFLPSPYPPNDSISETSETSDISEGSETNRNAMELPLDQPAWTYMLLGDSGEGDPHLLKRSALAIHAENIHFRRFSRDPSSEEDLDPQRLIVYMLGRDTLYNNYEPQVDESELRKIKTELEQISSNVGIRLVQLFFKYINPYFPILSHSSMFQNGSPSEETLSSMPISLKAVLYASALPYMVYDDVLSTMLDVDLPTAKSLYRMSWTAITQEIHTPRLSTLQACLLLLQRDHIDRYVQGSPFQWSLLAWTVSLAQTLGLSIDCSTVQGMPAWEKRLRKRLWWATYVLDKWNFATSGLTSHIHEDDHDVLPLIDTECASPDRVESADEFQRLTHFRRLVELTTLLSDTTTAFFTVKASQATASSFSATLEKANDLQARHYTWKSSLDSMTALQPLNSASRTRLDGNASLILAYWASHLLIFRAMLRSLESPEGTDQDKQLRKECRQSTRRRVEYCCVQVVDYVDQLQAGAWNAFWHKFSPSNFAIVSSVMMRLLISSTSPAETTRLNELIDRWRWVLRSGGGNEGGALMSLALLRLDRTLLKSRV